MNITKSGFALVLKCKENPKEARKFFQLERTKDGYKVNWVDSFHQATQFDKLNLIHSHLYFMKLLGDNKMLESQPYYSGVQGLNFNDLAIIEMKVTYPELV